MRIWDQTMKHLTQALNHRYVEKRFAKNKMVKWADEENEAIKRGLTAYQTRNIKVVKVKGTVQPLRLLTLRNEQKIVYVYGVRLLLEQAGRHYHEERMEPRELILRKNKVKSDRLIPMNEMIKDRTPIQPKGDEYRSFQYNRREAVRYAERWWNDYNPKYKKFKDNCTNFISQCLRAGGAPMRGYPDRSKGWWFRDDSWSYSWSVAHALRWYLSGSATGLTAREVENAKDLVPGDIICYDFDGDGNWQHNTIVVDKDANQEPLVNAQTYNSRMRYWKYEDSTAWTPNIQYKFFHIGE